MRKITCAWCLLLTLVCVTDACRSKSRPATAIGDFPGELQPYLIKIVTEGIFGHGSTEIFLEQHCTDSELSQLARSEHPILRETALRAMLRRKSFDHFAVLMSHLDDTAVIPTYAGEWGIVNKTVFR